MRYNPNSKFQTSINTFFTFIFLNLLFLFLSIPIFTIGITTTALMSSMIKFANEGDDRIIKNFFEYIKKDWYKSSISFFLLIIIIFIFLFSTFFWINISSVFGILFFIISLLCTIYLTISLFFLLGLNSIFENSILMAVKLSIKLPLVSPLKSLSILLIVLIASISFFLFPFFKIIFILIGVPFLFYCTSFILISVFKQIDNI